MLDEVLHGSVGVGCERTVGGEDLNPADIEKVKLIEEEI